LQIKYRKVTLDVDTIYLHPIGDLHIGHENSDLKFLEQTLNEIPKTPEHRIILMGDLVDVGIRHAIGGSVYQNICTVDDAIDFLCELFEPFVEQIDVLIDGNHEWRIFKEVGMNISKAIAQRLGIPYMKHSGVITYSFMKRAYSVNFFHGKSGGGVENSLRAVKAMSSKVFADVYLMGHCHHSAHTKRQIKDVDSRNGKVIELTQYFVLTGASLNYDDSYADQMNLEISTKGFPVITLCGNTSYKKIKVDD
jgi:hypothetical protein